MAPVRGPCVRDPGPRCASAKRRIRNSTPLLPRREASTPLPCSPVFDSQARSMVYVCVPIRSQGRLKGYIAGLYDFAELIHSLLENQLSDQYAVTVRANGDAFRVPAGTAAAAPEEFERQAPVVVGNAVWSVAVTPSVAGLSTLHRSVSSYGVIASALLYVCAVFARISRRRASDLETVNAQLVVENQERRRAEERAAQLNRDLQPRQAAALPSPSPRLTPKKGRPPTYTLSSSPARGRFCSRLVHQPLTTPRKSRSSI